MSRPYTGKITTGINKIKRKSGVTYVYERQTRYDKETRKTVTLRTRLVGKIMPGATETVPTRPKRKPGAAAPAAVPATRTRVGLTRILEWAGRESGVDDDVRACFPAGDADKILSLARYLVATDGASLTRIEGWQLNHPLPYADGLSENVYGALFKFLGLDEPGVQGFFSARAGRLDPNPTVAYDSTTVSTYSENLRDARYGFNKERDGLRTVKNLTLYSVKDMEPIAFARRPGNVPDVVSLESALEQLECFSLKRPLVTTDTGYYSESNLAELLQRNFRFLTLVDTDTAAAREAVEACRGELGKMDAVCPFDLGISGATLTRKRTFTRRRLRARDGKARGDEESFERRIHYHVFRSSELHRVHEANFRAMLFELKRQLEDGVTEFGDAARRKVDRYFVRSTKGRGGKLRVSFNEEECRKAQEYFGYYVLVSNCAMDRFEALGNYRLREKIEELFRDLKNSTDGRRPRVWTDDTLRGRQFVQFVALCYRCFIVKRLKALKAALGADAEGRRQADVKAEEKLRSWLEQRSLVQILDWFDCIEETTVGTGPARHRWSTETTARDRLFLRLLGVADE